MSKDTESGTAGAGINVAFRQGVAAGGVAWASVPGTGSTAVVEIIGCSTVRKLVRCSAPTVIFTGEEGVASAGAEDEG